MDVREYNDGKRGGRIRVRAKIEIADKKTLKITEIPFNHYFRFNRLYFKSQRKREN